MSAQRYCFRCGKALTKAQLEWAKTRLAFMGHYFESYDCFKQQCAAEELSRLTGQLELRLVVVRVAPRRRGSRKRKR